MGLKADDHAVEVLLLPEVHSLEELIRRHAQGLGRRQEAVDVLHALEGHLALLDLLHRARLDLVHQAGKAHNEAMLVTWVATATAYFTSG